MPNINKSRFAMENISAKKKKTRKNASRFTKINYHLESINISD